MRHLVPAQLVIGALVFMACSQSHGSSPDGAVPGDASGCTGAAPLCASETNHMCGDAFMSAACVDGAWRCPRGWTPEASGECWCYGSRPGCECTPSGWSCAADAGVGVSCPPDPEAAVGTPCTGEGRSCGECTDPCGFCNILRCSGGVWTRVEVFPPPPPCRSFDCGPDLRCDAVTTYCERTGSDVAGVPDGYRCVPYPAECTSCDCLPGHRCEGDAESGITVTWFGG